MINQWKKEVDKLREVNKKLLEACQRALGSDGLNHITDTKTRKLVESAIVAAEGRE